MTAKTAGPSARIASTKMRQTQDEADAYSLYHTLEEEIIPLFLRRDAEGIPHGWVAKMKNRSHLCARV